jgi:hypothetical protein
MDMKTTYKQRRENAKRNSKIMFLIAIVSSIALLTTAVIAIVFSVQFGRNCEGYLERAGNANSIDIARTELKVALDFLEKENLTTGYTSIMYTTPNEDIGFWYNNLKSAYNQLNSIDSDSISNLEESNILIKLRETLMDTNEGTYHVTVPDGISRYPNNTLFAILSWASILICVTSLVRGIYLSEKY